MEYKKLFIPIILTGFLLVLLSAFNIDNSGSDVNPVGVWTQGADMITPRFAGIGASYMRNDTGWLYAIGGSADLPLSTLNERYNINTDTWSVMMSSPSNRSYMGGARIQNYIYTICGMTSAYFSSEDKHCYRYDINSNTWTQVADVTPEPSQGIGGNRAVGYQDSLIYCAGGFNAGGSNAIASVYLYNANTNTWRTATSMPVPRCMGAFTVKGDTLIWVGGGTSYFAGYNTATYKGLISQTDRSQITWTSAANYPGTSRFRYDANPWGCKGIVVIGGSPSTFGNSTECYVYSPGNNTWTQQAPVPHGVGSVQSGSVTYSSGVMKLICAGGEQYPIQPYAVPYTQIFTDTCVAGPIILPVPFCEGFSSQLFPPAGWTLVYTGTLYWVLSGANCGGLGSAMYHMWSAPTGTNQELRTPNFSSITLATDSLVFCEAYAPYPSSPPYSQDSLVILGSTNNGSTWVRLAAFGPDQLQTAPAQNNEFIPTPSQWGLKRVSLPIGTNKISFLGKSDFGNDLYIDSICVRHPNGILPISSGVPKSYSLSQNYPNPFNPSTTITYALPIAGNVELKVFDLLGREVISLVNEYKQAGIYEVKFDASYLSSGIYLYRIKAGSFTDSKKMLLIK